MQPEPVTATSADEPALVSVLTVDDQPVFRDAARRLLLATRNMVLIGEADSGEGGVVLVERLRPDIVLMDVRMPGMGGVRAALRIKRAHPATVVILMSTAPPEELGPDAEACLADARVWKSDLRPRMLDELWQRHRPHGQATNS